MSQLYWSTTFPATDILWPFCTAGSQKILHTSPWILQEKRCTFIGLIADLGQLRGKKTLNEHSQEYKRIPHWWRATNSHFAAAPMQLTYWHVTAAMVSCVTFTLLGFTCILSSFVAVFPSLHRLLPSSDLPIHWTVHPHTRYPSQPSPCAHIYTHANTKMDQFHIPFQDAEEVVSHCQFMAQCLIPPNAAMQNSAIVIRFLFGRHLFLYGLMRSKTIISPPQMMLHLVAYFWK